MVDKDTILQVICGLMQRPQYLDETDKYNLTPDDFSSLFEKYIFAAIVNLHRDGAEKVAPFDIDNYLNTHKEAKALFEQNNGIEYLQDAIDFCNPDNFPFYYKRLKKFNLLTQLKKEGYDTSRLYEEDLSNPRAKEINDRFEEMDVPQILETLKKRLMLIETNFSTGDASQTVDASDGIGDLVLELQARPEIGSALQGDIFNTVCRGARKTKFYIRSASSGQGKSRAAVGDACMLAYPIRFNTERWEWEMIGACERTLYIATEQEAEEIQTLILAYLTGFNEEKILYGNYTIEEYKVVAEAINLINYFKDNLKIVRLSNPSISQIRAVVRQNWLLYDIKNVFYDYIFSSPSLLNEFRDLHIREDVCLNLLSTALKDLAVEMDLFVMSSTQTNAKADGVQTEGVKNESVIRGARSIIDKCDIACVISKVTREEEERLSVLALEDQPNQVMDVYKVRRGKYTNVRIWSKVDLGTCRKQDLFITDNNMNLLKDFEFIQAEYEEMENEKEIISFKKQLNFDLENNGHLTQMINLKEEAQEEIDFDEIKTDKQEEANSMFGGLL